MSPEVLQKELMSSNHFMKKKVQNSNHKGLRTVKLLMRWCYQVIRTGISFYNILLDRGESWSTLAEVLIHWKIAPPPEWKLLSVGKCLDIKIYFRERILNNSIRQILCFIWLSFRPKGSLYLQLRNVKYHRTKTKRWIAIALFINVKFGKYRKVWILLGTKTVMII